jgi:hypothetical protein
MEWDVSRLGLVHLYRPLYHNWFTIYLDSTGLLKMAFHSIVLASISSSHWPPCSYYKKFEVIDKQRELSPHRFDLSKWRKVSSICGMRPTMVRFN